MGTAFLGYVLPWGQISYWAATVITNLVRAVPFIGNTILQWLWGGFRVGEPTLTRFYTLHYLLPFAVAALVLLHLFYLHAEGSSNPLGVSRSTYKVAFHYFFRTKDVFYYLVFGFVFMFRTLNIGYIFIDAENFIPANALVTPLHIQPEWYFLFAYAILRSIPNKLGGVIALLAAVLVLFLFSLTSKNLLITGRQFTIIRRLRVWRFFVIFGLLTWLGAIPAEVPYIGVSQVLTVAYFIMVFLILVGNRKLLK